ncbi:DegT/DnrJ/EryC1/StrS family aminotransferase [Adhaeribacter pallidiroseus]|uniref:UDP-2-acetamido-2-deoxy-ribo-hexuluronate aminotransferase n=1 Tax=Adhaeribacter pallidiroseus TaxID=2072847 RepID=A0A369QJZ7_9BACT|nr:DegT/DnrJ/EryC1/StrS family aminotransferase [Adhaeribacter pallidiroseus]RDC63536.1 UDP-2-acetamido-2-deoxy-ribo-hexuluronate aminotransferase [Adhaeribacter pallidiroseus]
MYVPFLSFTWQNALIRTAVQEKSHLFFNSENYILGPEVTAFEQAYAAFNNTSHCVGVGNGLEALIISLEVLGVKPHDEVIVPANTYIATWLAVSQVGAVPVPVEPEEFTSNLDPNQIVAALTVKTKAILPVHLYGLPCNMTAIQAIADQHGLFIVEDNAQAHGARWQGQITGSFGHVNATSFYPTKNLGALGDGGAITTNQAAYARQARMRRNYGSETKNYNDIIGRNSRLDELQAAYLNVKLPFLNTWNAERRKIAAYYLTHLQQVPQITLPPTLPEAEPVFHLFVIHTPQRQKLQQFLKKQRIETAVHYPVPPHLQKAYAFLNYQTGAFPITEKLAQTCLSLPVWPGMSEEMLQYVCEKIKQFFNEE